MDIYIVGNFADAKDMCKRIEAEKIFMNVKYMDVSDFNSLDKKNRAYKLWMRFIKYLRADKELDKYVDLSGKTYDTIYYASRNQYSDYVIKHFNKKNKDLKICVFEDGLGDYFNADSRKPSIYKRFLFSIFGLPAKIYGYEEIWLYYPEFCLSIKDKFRLRRIPSALEQKQVGQAMLFRVFKYDNEIKEKVILFEQDYPIERQALPEILSKIDPEMVIFKPHPRKNTEMNAVKNVFKEKNIPWEIVLLLQNVQDKLLISINSTACFTPKLIFNQEPAIIFLYKVYDTGYKDEILPMDCIVKKLKEIYVDKNKIFVPRTIGELEEQLLLLVKPEKSQSIN